jgi:hypothetical protein
MNSPHVIVLVVFKIVLSYVWIIHRVWLRHVFREDHKPTVQTRIVILGGGFGGLYSALHFEKTIAGICQEKATIFEFIRKNWWAMRDSNPRPTACKAAALPLR